MKHIKMMTLTLAGLMALSPITALTASADTTNVEVTVTESADRNRQAPAQPGVNQQPNGQNQQPNAQQPNGRNQKSGVGRDQMGQRPGNGQQPNRQNQQPSGQQQNDQTQRPNAQQPNGQARKGQRPGSNQQPDSQQPAVPATGDTQPATGDSAQPDTDTAGQNAQQPKANQKSFPGGKNARVPRSAQNGASDELFKKLLDQGVITQDTYDKIEAYLKDKAPAAGANDAPAALQNDQAPEVPADGQAPEMPQGDQAPELPQDGQAPELPASGAEAGLLNELLADGVITQTELDAINAAIAEDAPAETVVS
ncbi:MAG: hypothetical protein IJ240_06020 [Clostridia bacterium]|nr:hypothetical protein [Clostridia bacterium]